MGFNTLVLILNDAMHEIDKDPKGWWHALKEAHFEAMRMAQAGRNRFADFGFGNHANGYSVLWNQHADSVGVFAVGKNYATLFDVVRVANHNHSEPENIVAILRQIADRHGYRLVRKTTR